MPTLKKKLTPFYPKYIKDSRGKIVEVYLDAKDFDGILQSLTEFEKTVKKNKNKKTRS